MMTVILCRQNNVSALAFDKLRLTKRMMIIEKRLINLKA
jgi:hypothetical protein